MPSPFNDKDGFLDIEDFYMKKHSYKNLSRNLKFKDSSENAAI